MLDQIALSPVAADPTDGDPRNAGPEEGSFHFAQAFGPDDAGDKFHS
jgi:hypothetical protein